MRKYTYMTLIVWLVVLLGPLLPTFAQSIRPLTEQEKAHLGATHEVRVQYSDFSEDSTNTAETLTMSVGAKQSVEFVSMMLREAFDTANTNHTGSLAVTVGDGNDTDRYLASTELASDGTEVFLKLGRSDWITQSTLSFAPATNATLTLNTTTLSYLDTDTNSASMTVVTNGSLSVATLSGAFVTNIAISAQGTLYTSSDTVDFTFTPNAEEALDDNTSGDVRFYLRVFDAAKVR